MAAPLPPPPPSAQQPSTGKKVVVGLGMCGVLFVALLIVGALAGDPDEDQAEGTTTTAAAKVEPEPATTEASPTTELETTTTAAAATTTTFDTSICDVASEDLVQLIEQFLVGEGWYLGETYVATAEVVFLTGNIYEADGTRRSNQDAWVIDDGVPYALSGSARSDSSLPDGRDLFELSPWYDPAYLRALSCTAGRNMMEP